MAAFLDAALRTSTSGSRMRRLCNGCFDTAHPKLAILCLRALGAPEPMLDVIDRFYGQHTRWLSVDGMFSGSPIEGAAALLQGCPFSPLCLNANFAVYLDDRTIWTRQLRGAARSVQRGMEAGAVADEALGFALHPAKLESFGSAGHLQFKLLGVPYNVSRLESRCKRIQLCGQSYSLRRALLARLVVPLFRWCAPWIRQLKKLTSRWAGAIERAVWGGTIPRGRSRALAWTTLVGLQFFPDYVNAEATVLQEHRRLHLARRARGTLGCAGRALSRRARSVPLHFVGFFGGMGLSGFSRPTLRLRRRAASLLTSTSRTTRPWPATLRATLPGLWWAVRLMPGTLSRSTRTSPCGCALVAALVPQGLT